MTTNPFKKIFTSLNSSTFSQQFRPFALKMEAHSMPPIVINVFKYYYYLLVSGSSGMIAEKDISPVTKKDFKEYAELDGYAETGGKALSETVIIKLNGGLGTSMGLTKAKSLLPAKQGMTFLEIILRQTEQLRSSTGQSIPLVFMNSFNTHADTMMQLNGFDNQRDIPLAFLQHKYPKVLLKDKAPVAWKDSELEWNPAGHGDIYTAMVTSGLLEKLLKAGYRYAFISNVDNLGAVMDERLLGYMAQNHYPFVMEVAQRTSADRKGGHLARLTNGRLVLREIAQCPEEDLQSFYDVDLHGFFNTNSIWLDLEVLEKVFVYNRMMPLDLIVNPKTVDPRNPGSPKVYQIETAMGSAISAFYNASAVCVPRERFSPVKTCSDLFCMMSDCYNLTDDYRVEASAERTRQLPSIELDSRYYRKIDDFQERFAFDVPSLLSCDSLSITGDVCFGPDVRLQGDVRVVNRTPHRMVVTNDLLAMSGNTLEVGTDRAQEHEAMSDDTIAA
jgi:UTP--glucose-1-phosphate uridylyltransferase